MSNPRKLLFIVCGALLPLNAAPLSAADARWKAPELLHATVTGVSGEGITFTSATGKTTVPKRNIQDVRDVAQKSIGVAGLRPGLVVSSVSLSADGTVVRSMTVAPQADAGVATNSRSNIQNNRTGSSGTTASDAQTEEGRAEAQKHAINSKGTGGTGRAAADHAINSKGVGGTGRAAADHSISTKGTGAAGRSSSKASPSPSPTPDADR